MPAALPHSHNTFVKSHEASGKLVVDFARNPAAFAVNQYVQVVPVPKPAGYYLEMTLEEAGRLVDANLKNFNWPDAADAPTGHDGAESFQWKDFRCERKAYAFTLGNMTVENATWDIVAQHASVKARQAMTARTQLVMNELLTTGNWDPSHVMNVTTIPGNTGNWADSTTARLDIERSIETAVETILDDTLGAVGVDDLVLVVGSGLAAKMSRSQEITDYMKGSPVSLEVIRGELPGGVVLYKLPKRLYGVNVAVETTRKVTSKKGGARAVAKLLPDANAILMSRVGGLEGMYGAPTFSTCLLFANREMQTYTRNDPDNERTMGRVVECTSAKLVAPASGVLFTNCG